MGHVGKLKMCGVPTPSHAYIYATMLQLADFLFVRRNWLRDQRRIQNTFSNIKRLQTPVWITSFVEGTRFSPIKLREVGLFIKYQREGC